MSMNKKEKNKFRKFLARIGISLIAAFGIRGATKQVLLPENTKNKVINVDELEELSKKDIPIDYNALNEEKMGKYLNMYYEAFMKKYPNINELVNSGDTSINNVLFSEDIYGFLKAYYADLSEKEIPLDDKNFSLEDFNKKVGILTYQNWTREGGDGLYLDGERIYKSEDPICKTITNLYIECKEEPSKNAELARHAYNVFGEKIGLKNRPTTKEIDDLIKGEIKEVEETSNRNGFIENLTSFPKVENNESENGKITTKDNDELSR